MGLISHLGPSGETVLKMPSSSKAILLEQSSLSPNVGYGSPGTVIRSGLSYTGFQKLLSKMRISACLYKTVSRALR